MKRKTNQYINVCIIFLLSIVLFVGLTMPFRLRLAAADITDLRPITALTPVLGLLFGLPAALGCGVGSLIADCISGYGISYALIGAVQQVVYGMVPWFLWKKLNREHDGNEFRLDSISRMLKFFLVMFMDALLIVLCTGILNHAYAVSDLLSINSIYLFFNSFDSGILFGCPLLIAGHFLQRYLENRENGCKEKIFTFSLNERMILNTIITGVGICIMVGAAVYLTEKMGEAGSSVGIWGRMYLFQTLALNFYFALSMGFMWFTENRIAKPIENLAEVAGKYYVDHATDAQRETMVSACRQYAGDSTEVGDLARSYISMVKDLEAYIDNLRSVTAEKERINAELTLASSIQAHMLPCIFPAFPEHDEFEVYATMTPAKEVGGDFYDFYMIDENHLGVVIADVSGKGVPAALFMVIAKTLIKNQAQMGLEVNDVFTVVNRLLCEGNDAGLFVTAWMGILDLTSGVLSFANAGHNPPLLKKKDGSFTYLNTRPGLVLAGMEGIKYRKNEITLDPGDRLFLYTDGVTEATNQDNRLYGTERLNQFLNEHSEENIKEILHGLKQNIEGFVGDAPQFDDITMLILDFKKHAAKAGDSAMVEQTFPAEDTALHEALDFVKGELEKYNCPRKTILQITMSLEEIFVNIAHYAYPGDKGEVKIGIAFDESGKEVVFRFVDQGTPFNPLEKPDPDVTAGADERQIGGLGIFMMKKMMDETAYCYENGRNILTMKKTI
ncbi:MAG: SpoIIE family protein phosphatase [Lachnospiraceae bacterium]